MTRVTSGRTSRWTGTITIAAAALLAVPVVTHARTGQGQTAPSGQPAAEQSSEAHETATKQLELAQEHLRKAGATLDDISAAALPSDVQAPVADLNRRITALQHDDAAALDGASATAGDRRRSELAAIERTLTALLGADSATGAPTVPGEIAVGTSGVPAVAVDEATRTKLEQVRTHMTAYAAAMGSVDHATDPAGAPATDPADPAVDPSAASAPPTADSATASTSPTDPTPTPTGTSPTAMPQTPVPRDARDQREGGAVHAGQHSDAAISRRHLTAARNTLSQMTQLPAAAEITGEARAQVSQLIRQFNELIAADHDWRASLDSVKASLERLIGGEPGAVPTTGTDPTATDETRTLTLDPQIRAQLTEFRTHLEAFEQAASRSPDIGDRVPATGAEPSSLPTGTTAAPSGVATRASETDPAAGSGSTSTGSAIAGMPGPAADTSATTALGPDAAMPDDSAAAAVPDEALRHIEAIEAILGRHGQTPVDRPTGTSGTQTADATTGAMLDASHVSEIRRHLSELRRLMESREPHR